MRSELYNWVCDEVASDNRFDIDDAMGWICSRAGLLDVLQQCSGHNQRWTASNQPGNPSATGSSVGIHDHRRWVGRPVRQEARRRTKRTPELTQDSIHERKAGRGARLT